MYIFLAQKPLLGEYRVKTQAESSPREASYKIGGSFSGRQQQDNSRENWEVRKRRYIGSSRNKVKNKTHVPECSIYAAPTAYHWGKYVGKEKATLKFNGGLCGQHACAPASMHPPPPPITWTTSSLHCVRLCSGGCRGEQSVSQDAEKERKKPDKGN